MVFREFVKLDQEHGEQRPGFTAPLAPDLARACTGTGMLESQTDPKHPKATDVERRCRSLQGKALDFQSQASSGVR